MRLKNMPDRDAVIGSRFDVQLDVALGIDNDRCTVRGKHVGRMREATQIKLFEVHGVSLLRERTDAKTNAPTMHASRLSEHERQSGGQRSNEFQAEAETVTGAHDRGHT